MSLNKFLDFKGKGLGFKIEVDEIKSEVADLKQIKSEQLQVDQIIPPLGGETCSGDTCIEGNLNVECDDTTKVNYRTPNFGSIGDVLSSKGDGTLEFIPIDVSSAQNMTASPGQTNISGITTIDELEYKCQDGNIQKLFPTNVGNAGEVLHSTGINGDSLYWAPDAGTTNGTVYNGAGTTASSRLATFGSNDGLTLNDNSGILITTGRIAGVQNPVNPGDVANKNYVDDEISGIVLNITTNTTDISTNITNIATNTSDIATNVTNISTNTAGVASNLSSINTNITDIATNVTDIGKNKTNITINKTGVTANFNSVNSNSIVIANHTNDISTNVTNIATNVTNIATNTSDIATNVTNISSNTAGVASNLSSINSNTANITSNDNDIIAINSALNNKCPIVGGIIPNQYIPPLAITKPTVYADIAARDADEPNVQEGDVAIVIDVGTSYIYNGVNYVELLSPGTGITSVNGEAGPAVSLTTTDIPENGNLYYTDLRVTANATVSTNSINVANNTGNITNNASSISQNGTDIGTNLTNIGNNATAISNISNGTTGFSGNIDIGGNSINNADNIQINEISKNFDFGAGPVLCSADLNMDGNTIQGIVNLEANAGLINVLDDVDFNNNNMSSVSSISSNSDLILGSNVDFSGNELLNCGTINGDGGTLNIGSNMLTNSNNIDLGSGNVTSVSNSDIGTLECDNINSTVGGTVVVTSEAGINLNCTGDVVIEVSSGVDDSIICQRSDKFLSKINSESYKIGGYNDVPLTGSGFFPVSPQTSDISPLVCTASSAPDVGSEAYRAFDQNSNTFWKSDPTYSKTNGKPLNSSPEYMNLGFLGEYITITNSTNVVVGGIRMQVPPNQGYSDIAFFPKRVTLIGSFGTGSSVNHYILGSYYFVRSDLVAGEFIDIRINVPRYSIGTYTLIINETHAAGSSLPSNNYCILPMIEFITGTSNEFADERNTMGLIINDLAVDDYPDIFFSMTDRSIGVTMALLANTQKTLDSTNITGSLDLDYIFNSHFIYNQPDQFTFFVTRPGIYEITASASVMIDDDNPLLKMSLTNNKDTKVFTTSLQKMRDRLTPMSVKGFLRIGLTGTRINLAFEADEDCGIEIQNAQITLKKIAVIYY